MNSVYKSKTIDHLGLVAGICEDLGIVKTINIFLPSSEEKIVSYGHCVLAMLLNGLGFVNQALYLSPHFFSDKPLDKLFFPGIQAAHLNDDALGRCLDAIYESGVSALYNQLVIKGLSQIGLDTKAVNMDITNFSVHGKYAQQDQESIQITEGYSKDHRPDLKQVSLLLITSYKHRIPLLMKALDGNSEETGAYKEVVDSMIGNLQMDLGVDLLMFDSKGYTQSNLDSLATHADLKWLCRAPSSLKSVKELIDQASKIGLNQMISIDENYSYQMFGNNYGGVHQRWQLVHSKALAKSKKVSTLKRINKKAAAEQQALLKLSKQKFSCQSDAQRAYDLFVKSLQVSQVDSYEIKVTKRYLQSGKPTKQTPFKHIFKIQASLSIDEVAKRELLNKSGFFVLTTNELDDKKIADKDLLKYYKGQDGCEKGFRFMKDPKVVSTSLNLKSNKRIEALLMIMTLCLLVYACLEYKIRHVLGKEQQEAFFPNQKGKPTRKPSARWVFSCFKNIAELSVNQEQKIVININEIHKKMLNLMGSNYWKYYS